MATSPSQTPEDLATPSPYVPTDAEIKHRLLQLQSHPSQQNRNPPPVPEHPEQPEPPPAASPQPPTPLAHIIRESPVRGVFVAEVSAKCVVGFALTVIFT